MTKKRDRYSDILSAGRELMAQNGYELTKVSNIVERASVAKGTFYLYFPTKLDLVIALVNDMQSDILSAALPIVNHPSKSEIEKLEEAIHTVFQVIKNYEDILPVFNAISAYNTSYWEVEKEIRYPYYSFLKDLIKRGQETLEFRQDLNADIASQLIVGMIEHTAHECFIFNNSFELGDFLTTIVSFLQSMLLKR